MKLYNFREGECAWEDLLPDDEDDDDEYITPIDDVKSSPCLLLEQLTTSRWTRSCSSMRSSCSSNKISGLRYAELAPSLSSPVFSSHSFLFPLLRLFPPLPL